MLPQSCDAEKPRVADIPKFQMNGSAGASPSRGKIQKRGRFAMQKHLLSRSVIVTGFGVTFLFVLFEGFFGKNQADHWQVLQYPNGRVEIRNRPGWYPTYFA